MQCRCEVVGDSHLMALLGASNINGGTIPRYNRPALGVSISLWLVRVDETRSHDVPLCRDDVSERLNESNSIFGSIKLLSSLDHVEGVEQLSMSSLILWPLCRLTRSSVHPGLSVGKRANHLPAIAPDAKVYTNGRASNQHSRGLCTYGWVFSVRWT